MLLQHHPELLLLITIILLLMSAVVGHAMVSPIVVGVIGQAYFVMAG